jgi:hypothetical protein
MNYKILKLNNGEELIGDVSENETSITITNPFVFVVATTTDMNGVPMDITFIKDWLKNSDVKNTVIDKSKIIIMTVPNEKSIEYYNYELNRNSKKDSVKNTASFFNEMDKFIEQMIEDNMSGVNQLFNPEQFDEIVSDQTNNSTPKKKKKKRRRNNPDTVEEKDLIYLNMVIPPEVLMNMITSGVLDPAAIQVMIEETKKRNKFTGDEKDRKDFGNKYSDWNPDPSSEDYK